MDENTILDKFGQSFVQYARDITLKHVTKILKGEVLTYPDFDILFQQLDSEQKQILLEFSADVIDGCLHSMMVMFEENEWIELRVSDADNSLRLYQMDLQAYALVWANRFSHQILSKSTK